MNVPDGDWKARAEALARLSRELVKTVQEGPCCGSADEMENTSHYHCPLCGEVGGMMVHGIGEYCPKTDPKYQRRQRLPGLVEKACDEILGVEDSSRKCEVHDYLLPDGKCNC